MLRHIYGGQEFILPYLNYCPAFKPEAIGQGISIKTLIVACVGFEGHIRFEVDKISSTGIGPRFVQKFKTIKLKEK